MSKQRGGLRALLALAVTVALAGCGAAEVRPENAPTEQTLVADGTAVAALTSPTPLPLELAAATRVADPPPPVQLPPLTATATPVAHLPANTPTATASVMPPRQTSTVTRLVLPTVTVASGIAIDPVLAHLGRDYTRAFMGEIRHNYLGAAVIPAHQTKVAEQSFGFFSAPGICHSRDSLMLWREDTRQIYFLLVENSGLHWDECPDYWQAFPDTWQPGDGSNEDIVAPAGKAVPTAGFGKVWREEFYDRSGYGIGFPSAAERYLMATVQQFEHGTAFYFHDSGAAYVLFDDFHYLTRGGETTGQLWFRVD